MAEELSRALPDTLAQVLSSYDLEPETFDSAGGTAGRTWRVRARRAGHSGDYFVRCRGARTSSLERIRFDHGLRGHLAERGFCAVPPLRNNRKETWVILDGAAYDVYPWVEGHGFAPAIADQVRLPVARALNRFHSVGASYAASCEPLVPQFSYFPVFIQPRSRFDDPAALLDVIDYVIAAYGTDDNRDAMRLARARVQWLATAYSDDLYKALPQGVMHGDFNGGNLLFSATGEVAAVFDFDWAWRGVRLRDIAEGMFFFGARRGAASSGVDNGGAAVGGALDNASIWSLTACPQFDLKPMSEFVAAYAALSPLAQEEIEALPLALLARWVACRTEGIMKVAEGQRATFFLADFQKPFEWFDSEAATLKTALTNSS